MWDGLWSELVHSQVTELNLDTYHILSNAVNAYSYHARSNTPQILSAGISNCNTGEDSNSYKDEFTWNTDN